MTQQEIQAKVKHLIDALENNTAGPAEVKLLITLIAQALGDLHVLAEEARQRIQERQSVGGVV